MNFNSLFFAQIFRDNFNCVVFYILHSREIKLQLAYRQYLYMQILQSEINVHIKHKYLMFNATDKAKIVNVVESSSRRRLGVFFLPDAAPALSPPPKRVYKGSVECSVFYIQPNSEKQAGFSKLSFLTRDSAFCCCCYCRVINTSRVTFQLNTLRKFIRENNLQALQRSIVASWGKKTNATAKESSFSRNGESFRANFNSQATKYELGKAEIYLYQKVRKKSA